MQFYAVLNRDGGTLRTMDLDAFADQSRVVLEKAGHRLRVEIVHGREIEDALDKAARSRADVVMAGGGDGTISAAAARLMNTKKALAVLPAGTMNLFARSLGVPLDVTRAVAAFAEGKVVAVDIASANGRPFVHQFSIGMHAKLVNLRSKMAFASRFGKIRASMKAAIDTITDPPKLKVELLMDGTELVAKTNGIGISNNLFGEGHLPYADRLDEGVLGIYITNASSKAGLAWFAANMAVGRWEKNAKVEIHQSEQVIIRILKSRRRNACVIDGELADLAHETVVRVHKRALNVLVPADTA